MITPCPVENAGDWPWKRPQLTTAQVEKVGYIYIISGSGYRSLWTSSDHWTFMEKSSDLWERNWSFHGMIGVQPSSWNIGDSLVVRAEKVKVGYIKCFIFLWWGPIGGCSCAKLTLSPLGNFSDSLLYVVQHTNKICLTAEGAYTYWPIEKFAQHIWLSYTICKMSPLVGNNSMQ